VLLPVVGLLVTASLSSGRPVPVSWASAPLAAPPASVVRRPATSRAGARVATPLPQVDPLWVRRTAAATGIPAPAVLAYGRATLVLAGSDPGCRLGWTTLAGIGAVESAHGTVGGRTLGPDGRSSSPVLGPALDGRGYAAVPATRASARWHGDPRWDHAVGPLQFISSTWRRWASDGDGDGAADPNDLDDAALAAGRYLCAGGQDLTTDRGWTAAVLSYNHADAYVSAVGAAARSFG